jgi:pimeloyl-ACP methyl ester carboxylesterase
MECRKLILCFTLAITGCSSLPGSQVKSIESRDIELSINSKPGPVVVFENGLGGRMEWWRDVVGPISMDTAYFTYNRPGYGKSSSTETPRDGEHIVDELRKILSDQGLKPPYVLVGHSIGGLYMQLFARKYPKEVSALILVDSTHPKQLEGAGAIENQSLWVRGALGVLVTGVARDELDLVPQTGKEVLENPVSTSVKVYVLSAAKELQNTSSAAKYTNELRKDIARMYPGSKQVWVDSSHAIPLERPDAVIDAVREAVKNAKNSNQ